MLGGLESQHSASVSSLGFLLALSHSSDIVMGADRQTVAEPKGNPVVYSRKTKKVAKLPTQKLSKIATYHRKTTVALAQQQTLSRKPRFLPSPVQNPLPRLPA